MSLLRETLLIPDRGETMRGLRGEEAAARGNTLEVDKLRALLDTLVGGNEKVSRTVHLGLISELRFKVEALERGFEVYDPVSPVSKADFVVRKSPHRPVLVQVKRAHQSKSGGWRFLCCTMRPGQGAVRYKRKDFDVFAVHVDDGRSHAFGFWPLRSLRCRQSLTWHPGRNDPPPNNWEILEEEVDGSG